MSSELVNSQFFVVDCRDETMTKHYYPDPHLKKQLDPDPQKMNADPQPCFPPVVGNANLHSAFNINFLTD